MSNVSVNVSTNVVINGSQITENEQEQGTPLADAFIFFGEVVVWAVKAMIELAVWLVKVINDQQPIERPVERPVEQQQNEQNEQNQQNYEEENDEEKYWHE